MIDKIIERLEKQFNEYGNGEHYKGFERATQQAIDIVKQVAEEENAKNYIIDELTRKSLVDRFANIISDYELKEATND